MFSVEQIYVAPEKCLIIIIRVGKLLCVSISSLGNNILVTWEELLLAVVLIANLAPIKSSVGLLGIIFSNAVSIRCYTEFSRQTVG